jgi:hypothetical protein
MVHASLHNFKLDFYLLYYSVQEFITLYPIPEIHTKRQAAQHGCLPSLQRNKGIKIVYDEEKTYLYWDD